MITTGKQTTDERPSTPLDVASSRLQSKGAAVFVLGIGKDVDPSELNQIASGPKNVFTVDSFEDLEDKAGEIKRGICVLGNVCTCTCDLTCNEKAPSLCLYSFDCTLSVYYWFYLSNTDKGRVGASFICY